jgi:hypothetical protein
MAEAANTQGPIYRHYFLGSEPNGRGKKYSPSLKVLRKDVFWYKRVQLAVQPKQLALVLLSTFGLMVMVTPTHKTDPES